MILLVPNPAPWGRISDLLEGHAKVANGLAASKASVMFMRSTACCVTIVVYIFIRCMANAKMLT